MKRTRDNKKVPESKLLEHIESKGCDKRDEKVAEKSDQNIIFPVDFVGQEFTSWPSLWSALNSNRNSYLWYRLEKKVEDDKKDTTYQVKCKFCKSEILVSAIYEQYSRLKLKVVSVDNIHNHNTLCIRKSSSFSLSTHESLTQLGQLFLTNKSFALLHNFQPSNFQKLIIREDQAYSVVVSPQSHRKQSKYEINYKIFFDEVLLSEKNLKFGVKTKKQLELIGMVLALSDCFCNRISKVTVFCDRDSAKLCGSTWQSSIMAQKLDPVCKSKYKIIKQLIKNFISVDFVGEEQHCARKKKDQLKKAKSDEDILSGQGFFSFKQNQEEEFNGFNFD